MRTWVTKTEERGGARTLDLEESEVQGCVEALGEGGECQVEVRGWTALRWV